MGRACVGYLLSASALFQGMTCFFFRHCSNVAQHRSAVSLIFSQVTSCLPPAFR